jgi:HAD superfamily hydrolase (TIGR01509 family)
MAPASADLVIFDCDGVLIDSEWIACEVEAEVLQENGFAIDAAGVRRLLLGLSVASAVKVLLREYGRQPDAGILDAIKQRTAAAFATRLQAIPGIHGLLDRLVPRRCVASSSDPERLRQTLSQVGLYARLAPHIFSATMVANGKPAPDLFLHAAARMAVHARRCVVIEDSVAGVRAARAAGMAVIGFIGGRHCDRAHGDALAAAGADRIIAGYEELSDVAAA